MSAVLTPIDLKRHAKVRAWVDLPGVPAGTPGKVLLVSGVTWMRYRVLFENGVQHGLLDGRHIIAPDDWVPVDERVEEVVEETSAVDAADDGAAAAAGADNPFGVPVHLLERAKAARARHGG
jgi:hypothetical protein